MRYNPNVQRLAQQSLAKCPETVIPVGGSYTIDSNTAGGMAFLEGQLEKIDSKLREPPSSIWWPRDIITKTGGGFVEYTSSFNVSYASVGGNQNGIIGGEALLGGFWQKLIDIWDSIKDSGALDKFREGFQNAL